MSYIRGLGFVVPDLRRSGDFLSEVLDFTQLAEGDWEGPQLDQLSGMQGASTRWMDLQLGNEFMHLMEYQKPKGRSYPGDSQSNDLWFQHAAIVVSNMEEAYARLMKHGVKAISSSPQTLPEWNTPAAGIKAFYFRSPAGHPLELIHFPPGKGRDVWQKPSSSLFLGIDHTAIAVSDTTRSLKFYRDLLGMSVAGGSLNHGDTQERLSGVPGAKVEITALRPSVPGSCGLEFLQYLQPPGGRPAPSDVAFTDEVCQITLIEMTDLEQMVEKLRKAGVPILSGGISKGEPNGPMPPAALVCDPDGHRLLLLQSSDAAPEIPKS